MPKPSPQPRTSDNSQAMSTLEFYQELFSRKPNPTPEFPWTLRPDGRDRRIPGGLTVAEYSAKLNAAARERAAAAAASDHSPSVKNNKAADSQATVGKPTASAIEEFNTAGYETPATSGTHSTMRGPGISPDAEELLKTTPGVYVTPGGNVAVSKSNVPPLPPGESYERNMQEMKGRVVDPRAWKEFKDKVQTGGGWDYKTKGNQFESTGNFNYGAAAEAMGIPDAVADRAAGAVQRWEHSPVKQWNAHPLVKEIGQAADAAYHQAVDPAHGDDPRDQENIRRGRVYAKQWKREQENKAK